MSLQTNPIQLLLQSFHLFTASIRPRGNIWDTQIGIDHTVDRLDHVVSMNRCLLQKNGALEIGDVVDSHLLIMSMQSYVHVFDGKEKPHLDRTWFALGTSAEKADGRDR